MYGNIRAYLNSKKNKIEDNWKKRPIIMDWLEYDSMNSALSIIDSKVKHLCGLSDKKLHEWFLCGDESFCHITAERYIIDYLHTRNINIVYNLSKHGGPDAILKCNDGEVGIEVTTINGFIADWIFQERLLCYLKEKEYPLDNGHQITYNYERLNTEIKGNNNSAIYDYIEKIGENIIRGDSTALQQMQVTWQKTDSRTGIIIWEHNTAEKFPIMKYLTQQSVSILKGKSNQLSKYRNNIVFIGVDLCSPHNSLTPRIFAEMGGDNLLYQNEIGYIQDYLAKNLPASVLGLCYYIYDIEKETPFYPLRMFWRNENYKIDINL